MHQLASQLPHTYLRWIYLLGTQSDVFPSPCPHRPPVHFLTNIAKKTNLDDFTLSLFLLRSLSQFRIISLHLFSFPIQPAINPLPFAFSEWLKDSMAHLGDAPKKVKTSLSIKSWIWLPRGTCKACLTTPKLQNRSCKLDLLAHAGKCKQNVAKMGVSLVTDHIAVNSPIVVTKFAQLIRALVPPDARVCVGSSGLPVVGSCGPCTLLAHTI